MKNKILAIGTVIAIVLAITITATTIYAKQPANEIDKEPTCGCTGGCKCLETQETCGCNEPAGCNCKSSCHT